MAILATFFLGNIGQENVFYDIQERKNTFLGYKKKEDQNVEKFTFSHCFGPKMAILAAFFFRQYRPGKRLLLYSKRKNTFLGYKNKTFKKSKN